MADDRQLKDIEIVGRVEWVCRKGYIKMQEQGETEIYDSRGFDCQVCKIAASLFGIISC